MSDLRIAKFELLHFKICTRHQAFSNNFSLWLEEVLFETSMGFQSFENETLVQIISFPLDKP